MTMRAHGNQKLSRTAVTPRPLHTSKSTSPVAVSMPEASIPKASVPKASVPKVFVPKASVPRASVPKASVLKVEIVFPEVFACAVPRSRGNSARTCS
eukprot:CAMPEP_0181384642 /NCGR_PEP_ID=MMETSP1106-20121128/22087_1 /TAXON_ID=81844 /ORGANISM="Mantoniella antarctica, Strain SL-175" /LENGTH=96 /DNA_ID=CAMNT_0023504553 /DNA_START=21 /DNA_END=308 /DNA_ORIENTATION=+